MRSHRQLTAIALGVAVLVLGAACGGSSKTTFPLTVTKAGTGAGTVTSTPAGIDCGATCAAQFDKGTAVTLTAAASSGSTFAGFSGGGCSGTAATCTVTVSAATTVTATFNPSAPIVKHTLRVFAWGGGTTDPAPGIHSYDEGTVVTLKATAGAGSFTGWSDGTSAATTTVTMDGDKLVGARFFDATATSAYLPPLAASGVAPPAGTPGNLQVLPWAGFVAAISYTFDDARVSQAIPANYAAIAAPGVPMTFFVSPSEVAKNLDFWKGVLADKHEIANHTEDHCMVNTDGSLILNPDSSKGEQGCAYPYGVSQSQQDAMDEIDAANDYIENTIGQTGVFTMASPYGDSKWVPFATAAGFIAHRRVGGTFVTADNLTDEMNLPDYWFGPVIEPGQSSSWGELGDTAAAINAKIDEVRTGNGWSTFLIHRVTPAPEDPADGCCAVPADQIAASMTHLLDLGDVWGGRVVDVAAYRIGKHLLDTATPAVSGATTTWTWALPPNFPPGKFVRVTVDGGTLSQKGQPLVWDTHGYYEVALDAGELTLGPPPSALKIVGTTGNNAAAGEHGLTVHFTIPATDLTAGNWTVSFDYYKPTATPDTQYTARQIQLGLGEAPWTSVYYNKYDGWSDTWRTVSYNLSTDSPVAGSKFAGAKSFNIAFSVDPAVTPDGTAVTWYLRNIVITDGAGGHTPLDLHVTTATDPSVASITTGTGTITIGMP